MKIVERRGYPGPNIYALYPVVRLTVDLGPLDERFSDELAGFSDRLLAALPALERHGCCYREPGGFVRRLHTGTLAGHILEHLAIAVQNIALGAPLLSFGKTRSTGRPREYHVVYQTADVRDGLAAGDVALRILTRCLPPVMAARCGISDAEIGELIAGYVARVRARALGPSTAALVAAARARHIPVRRLDGDSLIELGHGRHARWLRGTITENTGCIAAELACDKHAAARRLREAGLPVPAEELVGDAAAARAAAERIGYPVVVKPVDGNHGRRVRVGLRDPGEVAAAFEAARQISDRVLVQAQLSGADYRLLVVDGRLIAAARREPPQVIGDGEGTIIDLVAELNADPRRGSGHDAALSRVALDDEAVRVLGAQGLTAESVPERGVAVRLAAIANLSRGGTGADVTGKVHPDNARVAERAARALRLDVAGVDLVMPDIAVSWREGGGICEVNASPGLRMHLLPSAGAARDVAGPIVDMLFPPGRPHHVAIAALTGTNGKTTTARMLAHIQRRAGRRVGLATTDGVYADGELLEVGDLTGPLGARMALSDPRVDSAVLEVARGGILRAGLGFDACDVGAVLNLSADHLGIEGVETVSDMAFVKRVVVEVADKAAVLNADDPHVAAMAPYCRRAREIIWVSRDPGSELVGAHTEAGGRAVVLDRDLGGREIIAVVDRSGGGLSRRALIATAEIPATLGGSARFNVENAAFAAAMAVAGEVPIGAIAAGLATFESSFDCSPGRLNIYDGHPFRVILDYCHNAAAFRALGELVGGLEVPGRRILVAGMPGNRRDAELVAAAREAARHWDDFVLHDDDDRRQREPLEVPRLFASGLRAGGVSESAIAIVGAGEVGATRLALELARPGDLLVILGVDLDQVWRAIVEHEPVAAPSPRRSAQ